MLFLEVSVPSHGLLAIGGLICFVLGAGALYTTPGPEGPNASVAWPLIGVMAGLGVLFAFVVVKAAVSSRRMRPANVSPGLSFSGRGTTGQIGEVRRALDPIGSIQVAGEVWSARTLGEAISEGGHVRVVGQDGLTLLVEATSAELSTGDAAPAPAG
jgi:membrane-bound serine protease (ClpP class)